MIGAPASDDPVTHVVASVADGVGGIVRKLSKSWMRRARVSGSGAFCSSLSGASGIEVVGVPEVESKALAPCAPCDRFAPLGPDDDSVMSAWLIVFNKASGIGLEI